MAEIGKRRAVNTFDSAFGSWIWGLGSGVNSLPRAIFLWGVFMDGADGGFIAAEFISEEMAEDEVLLGGRELAELGIGTGAQEVFEDVKGFLQPDDGFGAQVGVADDRARFAGREGA